MPIYRKPDSDQEFDLPEDFDVETGVDRNREKALAKGYQVYQELTKDGTSTYSVPETELEKAFSKGYRPVDTEAESAAKEGQYGSVGKAEAAARGLAQVGTLGQSDELAGALKSPMGAVKQAGEFLGMSKADPKDPDVQAYTRERDFQRARDEQGGENQPLSYYGAQFGGALAVPTGAGLVASAPAKIGVLAAEGAAQGLGMSDDATVGEALPEIATGGAIGGVAGAVGPLMTKATRGVVGETGQQFVGNPALVDQAEMAPSLNKQIKSRIRTTADEAALTGETGLKQLKEQASGSYSALNDAAVASDGIIDLSADISTLVNDINLPPAIRQQIAESSQRILLSDLPANTKSFELEKLVRKAAGQFPVVDAVSKMQKSALTDYANMTRESLVGQAREISPEMATLADTARSQYSTLKNTENTLRGRLGTKVNNQKSLDSSKIRTRLQNAGNIEIDKLNEAGERVGIRGAFGKISQGGEAIRQNQQLASDLAQVKKPSSPLARAGQSIPLIGPAFSAQTMLDVYNTVDELYKRPALTAAVRMLTQGGKTLSYRTIERLAQQHGVNPDELSQTLNSTSGQ